MLAVTNLAGQTEALTGIQGFKMNVDVDRNLSVRFTTLLTPGNPGYALVEDESIIDIEGYLFKVKQLKELTSRKEVNAISIFYDLKGHRQETIYGGTHTLDEFATFVFQGSGWTFTVVDIMESRLIANFGEDNTVKLTEILCAAFECEMQIMPGKHVIFKKNLGGDYDAQYRYRHNVNAIIKNSDTTKLRTQITGYGADGLVVTYTSPNHTTFGIHKEDPVRDDQFATEESMTEHLKRILIDYPEVAYEMNTIELTSKELGERVWLIHEPMDIEFQTRILAINYGWRNDKLYPESVVLGNKIRQKLDDILVSQNVEIDRNRKETRSRFHQVNDRVTIEVEEIDKSIGSLNVQASEVSISVSNLMGRMSGAESTLSVQAGQISAKVSEQDFNGNNIVSKINLTAAEASIESGKINLVGFVTISSLNTPGMVTIHEGNIVGNSFTVGRGSGNPQLSMYAIQGSHRIVSSDGAGFRVESTGTMSLKSGSGKPITMLGFTRIEGDLSVEPYNSPPGGATPLLATNVAESKVVINGRLEVSSISVGGLAGLPALFT